MKKKRSTIIAVLAIIAGLSLILYPTVSNILKTIAYNRAIEGFQYSMETLDDALYDEIMAQARDYNARQADREYIMLPFDDVDEEDYYSQLVIPGTDVMGYVVIPKINVSLPIYHGTSDEVLEAGVGHLMGSSLPVGGDGTHSVLSGHSGLPSARLFTDLDQLVEGDTFTIRVLREVLTYEVDDIQIVLPNESAILQIEPDQDYCTLLTCTPYGVNTHRLLVRGHRIPTPEEELAQVAPPPEEQGFRWWIAALAGAIAVALAAVLAVVIRRRRRRRRRRRKKGKHSGARRPVATDGSQKKGGRHAKKS